MADLKSSADWAFLVQNAWGVAVMIGVFIFFAVIGYAAFPFIEESFLPFLEEAFAGIFVADSKLHTALNIFANNVFATLLALLSGITIVVPALIVAVNGFLVGAVANYAFSIDIPASKIILGIAPHGVFELTAFFVNAAIAPRLGWSVVFPLPGKTRKDSFLQTLRRCLRLYVVLIAPLLLIAAFIESYVTAALIL